MNQIRDKIAQRGFDVERVRSALIELGDRAYPGYGVAPSKNCFNDERPAGMPLADTLLRVAAQPIGEEGWRVLCQALIGRDTPTRAMTQRRNWERDRASGKRKARTVAPRPPKQEPPLPALPAAKPWKPPVGLEARVAVRPLIEWRPTENGEWDYVKAGEYTVWELS